MFTFWYMLFVLKKIVRKYTVQVFDFLDWTANIPIIAIYIPFTFYRYLDGRVFVLDLLQGSQAQADMFAEPGDIIDEINGISLRNASNGQVRINRTYKMCPTWPNILT